VPALHLQSPITATTTDVATGELVVPPDPATVVWWAGGARPGDPTGSVTMAGHVDYNGVAGALFNLRSLPVGSLVTVTGANGRKHAYVVTARRQVRKASLDQLNVFTTGGPPQLVLLTCGGAFDSERRSYDDNVIVIARPAGLGRTPSRAVVPLPVATQHPDRLSLDRRLAQVDDVLRARSKL